MALEFSRSQREGQVQTLALLLIDVDFFKRYNDHYGHPQGDLALQALAQVLSTVSTRAIDLAARIGGEEFVLMLTATSKEGAHKMAQRIQQLLADSALPHAASAVSPWLTVSMGIALCDSQDESPSALLSRADRALYQAKATGRNRFVFDDRPVASQLTPTTLQAQD
jgi:diguanylate cyclase (GGDEF)-like protein